MLSDGVVKSYAEKHNCSYANAYADCERIIVGLPVKEHKSRVDEFGGEGSGNFGHEGRPGEVGGSEGGGKEPAGGGVRNKQKSPSWAAEKGARDQSKKERLDALMKKNEEEERRREESRKKPTGDPVMDAIHRWA